MDDMNHLPLRIWLIVSITLLIGAAIVRLAWAAIYAPSAGYLFVVLTILLVTLGIYVLSLYLIIKPGLRKLKSLPVRIWGTIIMTGALIDGIVHYVRFVPSPEAASPISVIIASLLLIGGTSAYLLALWVIWSIWKARES